VIGPSLRQILDFCAEEPVERVFLEDVARQSVGRFAATVDDGELTALCHLGANVVPSGSGCGAFASELVRTPGRMVIGEEGAVSALWDAASGSLARPRLDRPGQPVYVTEEPPGPGSTGLRSATPADIDLLLPACVRMHEEEMGEDPLQRDAAGFRRRTEAQIAAGRSWIWEERGTILFKAEASAWTAHAVQLQQVWVDPSVRGLGYATRGMRDLCRLLLRQVPRVCLFVRADNPAAIRAYESIGMRRAMYYRSIVF